MSRQKTEGAFYLDALLGMVLLMAVIISFISIPEVFIKKQNVDYIARMVVRRIEQEGKMDVQVQRYITELTDEVGIHPAISWSGNFQGPSNKLQLRERFRIEVRYPVKIKIVEPSFREPVYLEIQVSKTLRGVSEVYWKDL